MNPLNKTVSEQIVPITMILVGVAALLVSFVEIPKGYAPLAILLTMIFGIAVAYLLTLSSEQDIASQSCEVLTVLAVGVLSCIVFSVFLDGETSAAVLVSVLVCGTPIVVGSLFGLVRDRDITADVLVSVAIIASLYIGEYHAAAEISIIMQIGALLEEITVKRANDCIAGLHSMKAVYANLVIDGKIIRRSVEELRVGDIVRILPGETVPADGMVVSGASNIDTSLLTGESVPRDVSPGSNVFAGAVNLFGCIDIEVSAVGGRSTIARMAELLSQADAGRSRIVRLADRWARIIVAVAMAVSISVFAFTGDAERAVTVLVVFCPCALVLATPTAIMAAAGNMSRRGILVKDGGALERLASVDTFLMDKTGTLTEGKIACSDIISVDSSIDSGYLALLLASVECSSEHPLGKAISAFTEEHLPSEEFRYIPGRGVSALVDGRIISAGNRGFIRENCPEGFDILESKVLDMEKKGYMTVLAGIDGRAVGFALLSDSVKSSSRYAVRHLRMLGLKRIIVTGDSENVAVRMRDDLQMDDVVWECLPSDKLRIVSDMDSAAATCMIGDGINDAPALKRSSVGISMGGMGTTLAMDSSDFVFLDDDLSKLPNLIRLAKRTMLTIKLGIAFSLILNTAAMVLAVLGLMDPIQGALVHNIGSVIVIIAAGLLLKYDAWRKGFHKKRGCSAARTT